MQDRFKFRVWLNKSKRYTINKDDIVLFPDGAVGQFDIIGCYDEKDVTVEFCTGLKDKNGKLIYEGDILQDSEQKILVKYDVNRHCFMFEYQDTRAYKPICDIDVLSGNFEVIGNIHENADLLENKDEFM